MNIEKNNLQVENNTEEIKRDDSKDPITIDYYDRINHKWIKVETTKEVARVLHCEDEKTRKANNRYNNHNYGFDDYFDQSKKCFADREHYLHDESADIDIDKSDDELIRLKKEEQQRTLIENSLDCLSAEQREAVEKTFYENKSQNQIAKELGVSQQSISERLSNAKIKIKNHIKNTEN